MLRLFLSSSYARASQIYEYRPSPLYQCAPPQESEESSCPLAC
jgi:hypothetical protein